MKVVLAGGSGNIGQVLKEHWGKSHEVIILGRKAGTIWDGKTLGSWTTALENAHVLVNLAGRSVNCRYTSANLNEMMDSRIDSTRVLGEAIKQCTNPPRLWLQSSTATIYAHRFDAPNDEATGILGGNEPNAPRTWQASIEIAKAWEEVFFAAETPATRKIALRSAMTMSPQPDSVFGVLAGLARKGLGGRQGDGKHYVSWIHEHDFVRALDFLIEREDIDGPVNICSPNPLTQEDFTQILRKAVGARWSIPLLVWILEIGAWLRQTETELILKSRRVVPTRLLTEGFTFDFPTWSVAARDLAAKLPTA